jgi:hypothetical protein
VAWQNGLHRLAEFEIAVAGGHGVACSMAWLVLSYSMGFHCNYFVYFFQLMSPGHLLDENGHNRQNIGSALVPSQGGTNFQEIYIRLNLG